MSELTKEDALEFKRKIHERCSHCEHYRYIDGVSWKCFKSTDVFLCELFKKRAKDPVIYYSLSCDCSIEVRICRYVNETVVMKETCPRCGGIVELKYYHNAITPGYSDYEGEYLFDGVKGRCD